MRTFRLGTRSTFALYGVLVALFLAGADYFYARNYFPPTVAGSSGSTNLAGKVAWYKAHPTNYNMIFLGDSKTYCGIHPELLDPLLGTSSLNLAMFTNWFPTQLPIVQDIVPLIPKGTTVVWSIGTVNFLPTTDVQRIYPVGFRNAVRYLGWSVPSAGLLDNLLYYSPVLHFLSQRGEIRKRLFDRLASRLDTSIAGFTQARADDEHATIISEQAVQEAMGNYKRDPAVAAVGEMKDGDKTTSFTVYFQRGSYYRVELDPPYFRRKQQEIKNRWGLPTISPSFMRLFEEMLHIFKENNINVIINELEEAPFMYGPGQREQVRTIMSDVIAKKAAEFGFPFVRVDFDKLTDEDYFDYNHLNSRGAKTFTPMLADQLRPYLTRQGFSAPPRAALGQ